MSEFDLEVAALETFEANALEARKRIRKSCPWVTILVILLFLAPFAARSAVLTNAVATASFTWTPQYPQTGQDVTFTDTSTGAVGNWQWGFGDCWGALTKDTTHVFVAAGVYHVYHHMADAQGFGHDVTIDVTVTGTAASLTPSFTWSPSAPIAGQDVTFTDMSTSNLTSTNRLWDFGDGSSSGGYGLSKTIAHTFRQPGTYHVALSTGCNQIPALANLTHDVVVATATLVPTANFTFAPSSPTSGQQVSFTDTSTGTPTSWLWNFGDGATLATKTASHAYASAGTYSVSLTVSNTTGSSTATKSLSAQPAGSAPIANFTYTPPSPSVGQAITFTDASSGAPTSWSWAFGDVGAANTPTTTHTFANPGTFTVALVATNAFGSSSISKQVAVTADVPTLTADFTYSPTNPTAGTSVQFTDRSTGASSHAWNFGDGSTVTDRDPTHVFASANAYDVKLTVSNSSVTASVTKSVNVGAPSCTTCVTISGRVLVSGSDVRVIGDGSFARSVFLVDPAGLTTTNKSVIDQNGFYSITAPKGQYSLRADIHYTDHISQFTSPDLQTLRRAIRTTSLQNYSANAVVNIEFPRPIVFLHGILNDGPGKWTTLPGSWGSRVGSNTSHPDTIFFTPSYEYTDTYDRELVGVALQLFDDFAMFNIIPPYDVIAHSKGGLVARVLRSYPALGDAMKSVILLGTPNGGSDCFSASAASLFHLSHCEIQSVNSAYPPGFERVFAIAGTKSAPLARFQTIPGCPAEAGSDDGLVPLDSVFKVTTTDATGGPSAVTLPGIVVPYSHTELGDPETAWLIDTVVFPFIHQQPFFGTRSTLSCPGGYTTTAALCSAGRPVESTYCYGGRGLTSDGRCTLVTRTASNFGVALNWSAPTASGLSPLSLNATLSTLTGCASLAGAMVMSEKPLTAADLVGYQVYRSPSVIAQISSDMRIGFVSPTTLTFFDPAPASSGVNFYAVTAVYASSESSPSVAPALTIGVKQRAVRH